MLKMLDLFSGLGGASEAMVNDPKWEVLRIENNPLLSGVQNMSGLYSSPFLIAID